MNPEESVRRAEEAYQSQDVDRIVELFDPEIVFYWNGRKQGEGLAEVRAVHEGMFAEELEGYEIRKTLRAASGDTIAVEWTTTWIDTDGNRNGGYGGEFWTMRDGRLPEWHAYHRQYVHDGADDEEGDEYLNPRSEE